MRGRRLTKEIKGGSLELTINCNIHFKRERSGRKCLIEGVEPTAAPMPPGNIPRVSRLMALAIRLERMVSQGELSDYADIARLGQVSRARVTQLMNLLQLAPDIQEALLYLPLTVKGRDPINERDLRPIAAVADWQRQREMWKALIQGIAR